MGKHKLFIRLSFIFIFFVAARVPSEVVVVVVVAGASDGGDGDMVARSISKSYYANVFHNNFLGCTMLF